MHITLLDITYPHNIQLLHLIKEHEICEWLDLCNERNYMNGERKDKEECMNNIEYTYRKRKTEVQERCDTTRYNRVVDST